MERPTITINGKKHEMIALTGHSWRLLGEFVETAPDYADADFIEKHAAFIAQFYSGVAAEDILDLPLENILPASAAIRKYVLDCLTAKLEKIEKNVEMDKAQLS